MKNFIDRIFDLFLRKNSIPQHTSFEEIKNKAIRDTSIMYARGNVLLQAGMVITKNDVDRMRKAIIDNVTE